MEVPLDKLNALLRVGLDEQDREERNEVRPTAPWPPPCRPC